MPYCYGRGVFYETVPAAFPCGPSVRRRPPGAPGPAPADGILNCLADERAGSWQGNSASAPEHPITTAHSRKTPAFAIISSGRSVIFLLMPACGTPRRRPKTLTSGMRPPLARMPTPNRPRAARGNSRFNGRNSEIRATLQNLKRLSRQIFLFVSAQGLTTARDVCGHRFFATFVQLRPIYGGARFLRARETQPDK